MDEKCENFSQIPNNFGLFLRKIGAQQKINQKTKSWPDAGGSKVDGALLCVDILRRVNGTNSGSKQTSIEDAVFACVFACVRLGWP